MQLVPAVMIAVVPSVIAVLAWAAWRQAARANFVRDYRFPPGLLAALGRDYPHLRGGDLQLVGRGLRQFFLAWLRGGRKPVSMPSQVVDALWHAFILHTRAYDAFCRQAFGRFLHHTPASVLGADRRNNEGLRRVWWHACREENIDPRKPTRLPLLFALDAKLGIEGGYRYALDCARLREARDGTTQCAGDFGDAGIDGSTDGFGDGSGDGGDGDGGGCGGD
ncbi:MAG: hypothetical protein J0L88_13085 [Xanthomonadales bacterium]|nr:hypothetical protein [Xanthomonadales bacterium]